MIKSLQSFVTGVLLLSATPVLAQTYQVSVNEMVKDRVMPERFIGTDKQGNVFVAGIRTKVRLYLPLMVYNHYDFEGERYIKKYDKDLNLVSDKILTSENPLIKKSQINSRITLINALLFFNSWKERNTELPSLIVDDKYYMVVQDNKAPYNNYYALEVDRETGIVGKLTQLLSLSKNKNDKTLEVKKFDIKFSPDSSHILFLATYERDKSSKSGVAYSAAVFTRDLKPLFSSKYTLPKESKSFNIQDAQLTNNAEILILGRYLDKKQKLTPGYVSIFSIKKNEVKPKETRLKFGTDFVNEVLLSLNSGNEPLIIGFYKTKMKQRGLEGVYYAYLNENKELYNITKKKFSTEFVVSTFTEKQAKKTKRKEKNGKDIVEDGDFSFSELIKSEDGGYVGIAENYYMLKVRRTSTNRQGGVTTTTEHIEYHHCYGDLMAFKFDKDGNLQTMNKIAKKKVYISAFPSKIYDKDYTSFNSGERIFLVFNDDPGKEDDNTQKNGSAGRDVTYIVCVKPDGNFSKDQLLSRDLLGKYMFDPHLELQKLSDNKLCFIATKNGKKKKKTMMGSFVIN